MFCSGSFFANVALLIVFGAAAHRVISTTNPSEASLPGSVSLTQCKSARSLVIRVDDK